MKLCSMKLESCIKIDRVALLKTLFYETFWSFMKLILDRTCPIPYNMFDDLCCIYFHHMKWFLLWMSRHKNYEDTWFIT